MSTNLDLEVPAPVLFNPWKHHAGALRWRIARCPAEGPAALPELARTLLVLGTKLMDLYTGSLAPAEIARQVVEQLRAGQRLEPEAYRRWVGEQTGYALVTLDDGSQWCLRAAEEEDRYVHLHPGRHVPHTCRVKANTLRTAVLVLAHVGVHGGDPLGRETVNAVRREHLELEPLGRDLDTERGLGEVIALLTAN